MDAKEGSDPSNINISLAPLSPPKECGRPVLQEGPDSAALGCKGGGKDQTQSNEPTSSYAPFCMTEAGDLQKSTILSNAQTQLCPETGVLQETTHNSHDTLENQTAVCTIDKQNIPSEVITETDRLNYITVCNVICEEMSASEIRDSAPKEAMQMSRGIEEEIIEQVPTTPKSSSKTSGIADTNDNFSDCMPIILSVRGNAVDLDITDEVDQTNDTEDIESSQISTSVMSSPPQLEGNTDATSPSQKDDITTTASNIPDNASFAPSSKGFNASSVSLNIVSEMPPSNSAMQNTESSVSSSSRKKHSLPPSIYMNSVSSNQGSISYMRILSNISDRLPASVKDAKCNESMRVIRPNMTFSLLKPIKPPPPYEACHTTSFTTLLPSYGITSSSNLISGVSNSGCVSSGSLKSGCLSSVGLNSDNPKSGSLISERPRTDLNVLNESTNLTSLISDSFQRTSATDNNATQSKQPTCVTVSGDVENGQSSSTDQLESERTPNTYDLPPEYRGMNRQEILASGLLRVTRKPRTDLSKQHVCSVCGHEFHTEEFLQFHFKRNVFVLTYYCRICHKLLTFHNKCIFVQHILEEATKRENLPLRVETSFMKLEPYLPSDAKNKSLDCESQLFQSSSATIGDNGVTTVLTSDQSISTTAVPSDQSLSTIAVHGDQNVSTTAVPVDQSLSTTAVPGDQNVSRTAVPGDQNVSPTAVPGDQNVSTTAVPGDQNVSTTAVPGDQNVSITAVPGDQNVSTTAVHNDPRVSTIVVHSNQNASITVASDETSVATKAVTCDQAMSTNIVPSKQKISTSAISINRKTSTSVVTCNHKQSTSDVPSDIYRTITVVLSDNRLSTVVLRDHRPSKSVFSSTQRLSTTVVPSDHCLSTVVPGNQIIPKTVVSSDQGLSVRIVSKDPRLSTTVMPVDQGPSTTVVSKGQRPLPRVTPNDQGLSTSVVSSDPEPFTTLFPSDQGPSTLLYSNAQGPSSTLNSNDQGPSSTLNSNDKSPSTTLNSSDQGPSTTLNSSDQRPSSTLNSGDQRPSTTINSNSQGPSTTLNSNDQGPSTMLNSNDQDPSTTLNANDQVPLTTLDSNEQGPSTTLNSNDQGPLSTTLYSIDQGPSTTLNSNDQGPSTTLNANDLGPSTTLDSNDQGPSTTHNSNDQGPLSTLNSNDQGPSTTLNSNDQGPSTTLNANDPGPSTTLDSNDQGPSTTFNSNDQGPSTTLNSNDQGPSTTVVPNDQTQLTTEDISPIVPWTKFRCQFCISTFPTMSCLFSHFQRVEDDQTYSCHICKMELFNQCSLSAHLGIHNAEEKKDCVVTCPECGETLLRYCKDFSLLFEHLDSCGHFSVWYTITCLCGKVFNSYASLTEHFLDEHLLVRFQCRECGLVRPGIYLMYLHYKNKHPLSLCTASVTVLCPWCKKYFTNPTTLKNHIAKEFSTRNLAKQKVYQCIICSGSFSSASLLNTHQAHFHIYKPKRCTLCFGLFMGRQNLVNHLVSKSCRKKFPTMLHLCLDSTSEKERHFDNQRFAKIFEVKSLDIGQVNVVSSDQQQVSTALSDKDSQSEATMPLFIRPSTKAKKQNMENNQSRTCHVPSDLRSTSKQTTAWDRSKHQCHLCKICLIGSINFKKHMSHHRSVDSQTGLSHCIVCKKMVTETSYSSHMEEHQNHGIIVCSLCHRRDFPNLSLARDHSKNMCYYKEVEGWGEDFLREKSNPPSHGNADGMEHGPRHENSVGENRDLIDSGSSQDKSLVFPCLMCGLAFTSKAAKDDHVSRVHDGTKTFFLCLVCKRRGNRRAFNKKQKASVHITRKHRIVNATEISKLILEEEQNISSGQIILSDVSSQESVDEPPPKRLRQEAEDAFLCGKCGFSNGQRDIFEQHIETHNPKGEPQCPECGLCFIVNTALKKHLFAVHRIKDVEKYMKSRGIEEVIDDVSSDDEDMQVDVIASVSAEECEENPLKSDKSTKKRSVTDNPLECNVCYKSFTSELVLKSHMRNHGMAFIRSRRDRSKDVNSISQLEST